jgi:hypothetical protein
MNSTRYDFVISRNAKTDDFQCWKFDPEDPNLLIQSSANLGLSIVERSRYRGVYPGLWARCLEMSRKMICIG